LTAKTPSSAMRWAIVFGDGRGHECRLSHRRAHLLYFPDKPAN